MGYSKMNPKWKASWLEALRSDEYKQTTTGLWSSSGHCCLGVLCDVYDKEGWQDRTYPGFKSYIHVSEDGLIGTSNGFIPENMLPTLGLCNMAQHELSRQNDAGAEFLQIADWIEDNL